MQLWILKMRLYWNRVSEPLTQYDLCPYNKLAMWGQRHRECHTKMRDWSDAPMSQGHQRVFQKPGRRRNDSGTHFRGHVTPLTPWFWTWSLQNYGSIHSVVLIYSVCGVFTAALGRLYNSWGTSRNTESDHHGKEHSAAHRGTESCASHRKWETRNSEHVQRFWTQSALN